MRKINLFLVSVIALLLMSCVNLPKEYASYDDYPVYEGNDLEVVYSPLRTKFKLWSPAAKEAKLNLYH